MITRLAALLSILTGLLLPQATGEVLIVADEFPAMEVLVKRLKMEANTAAASVDQSRLPKSLNEFEAVVVYIHKELAPAAERAFIDYAERGGRLVLLHHSISSGKRQNKDWFRFLGVELPQGPVDQGGYQWTEGVTVQWINLAADDYVMTHQVSYPERVELGEHGVVAVSRPAFTLRDTEVYLNHVLKGPHTILMALRYADAKTGRLWVQETAGWRRRAGEGWVFYFMPGHALHDFENPVYGRVVMNAITVPFKGLR